METPKIGTLIREEDRKRKEMWKQEARSRPALLPIEHHRYYTPAEVTAILNASYETAVRKMEKMKGCIDMGTKERRYKRGKRMLRVPGSGLLEFLRSHLVA